MLCQISFLGCYSFRLKVGRLDPRFQGVNRNNKNNNRGSNKHNNNINANNNINTIIIIIINILRIILFY